MGRETVAGRSGSAAGRSGLLAPGDRIPALVLPSAPEGRPVRWRDGGRDTLVVVFLRSAESDESRDYVRRLAEAAPAFRPWAARVMAVVPGELQVASRLARELNPPFPLLADEDGAARRRCGVDESAAALLIADRWGQLYHTARAPSESGLPEPGPDSIIMQWLRYIATQCPECGVPDEPGRGEWAR